MDYLPPGNMGKDQLRGIKEVQKTLNYLIQNHREILVGRKKEGLDLAAAFLTSYVGDITETYGITPAQICIANLESHCEPLAYIDPEDMYVP